MPDWLLYFIGGIIALVFWVLVLRWVYRWSRRRFLMKRHGDAQMVDTIMEGNIARGMSLDMVLDAWGKPADMDEVVMKTKTKRELKYDQKGKNRFGTRVYLENGEVVGWETK